MTLTVYSRSYCHLCDEMIAGLRELQAGSAFGLVVVDVDGDERLEARYGERVPVLACGDAEICHYFLDRAALAEHLRGLR